MKYYDYNELKSQIIIEDRYKEKFREQTDLERNKLKEGLIYHQRVLEPLKVSLRFSGVVLIDGHHRWKLLPEVIKECPDFDLNIPVVLIKSKDVADEMLRTQLGRRNLSNEDIKQYVDRLITEDNLSANKAYKQVAEAIDKSISTVKRIHKPEQAEANRVSQKVRDITKKSSDERMGITDDISVKMTHREKPVKSEEEIEINIDNKYKIHSNGTEEYTGTSSSELERLDHIKDTINQLESYMPYFKKSVIYSDIKTLISNYKSRVKKLKRD